ncbi:MAG: glycosyltransferase [Chloroflexi bacterium]|nr:glycosyltransferase [Chloroflexota bacterium]
MRVLLLSQIVPYPPDSGPRIKTYHVLRYLASRGHQVTLATFVRPGEEKGLDVLREFCHAVYPVPMRRSRLVDARDYLRALARGTPFLVERDSKQAMHDLVQRLTSEQSFDIVHADQLTMGQYALGARSGNRIFDAHNAVWAIVERARTTAFPLVRPALALEARRLQRYEGMLCRAVDGVLAVSAVDQAKLVQAGARAESITVIPIAIDCGAQPPLTLRPEAKSIVSASTLFYPPNADGVRWFARDVYPLVRREQPDADLTLIGARPPHDLVSMNGRDGITVTGYVPDVDLWLSRAAVMVVPVRAASGMRVRILEALSRGIPVVSTTMGVEGIEAVHDIHLLIADDAREFAAQVVRLLADPALRIRLASAGRALVQAKYDWQVALPAVEAAYAKALQRVASN